MQAASMLSMATSLKSCSSEQTSRLYLIFSKCLLVMIQLSLLPGMLLLLQPLDTEADVGSCRKDKIVELNETSGKIFSPMYPRDFPRGTSCTWLITAPEGLHVRLKLKKTELDGGCLSALHIRNGKDSSSPLLQKYCGQEPDKASSVFSSDRYLWVNFSSKNAVKGDYHAPGFRAEYEVVQQLPAPFSCKFRDGPLTLYGASGNLASYIYPLPCDESIICIWKFMMSSEYEIELSFDSFDLSYSNLSYSNCTDDYVEIRRVKYCGSNAPPTVTLDRSSMSVTFRSSGKGTYPGFKASYTSKRTTASVLKSVALCLGFLLVLCIATFFCWKCMKPEEEDKEETGHASGTECTQVSNEPGSAM